MAGAVWKIWSNDHKRTSRRFGSEVADRKEVFSGQIAGEKLHVQIHVEVGPASEGMAHLAQQGVRWDLAFIDADKTGYLGYYNQVCMLVLSREESNAL